MAPTALIQIFPLGSTASPMIREARPMMTMPLPRLISAVFWYWARSAPDRAVQALAMHRPTVMVKEVLMELARTMSGLSPVARMDRPSRVFRNRASRIPTQTISTATGTSL